MMSEVYSIGNLRTIPWAHYCNCLTQQIGVAAAHSIATPPQLDKDSVVGRALYELVVSPWPLTFWTTFRAVVNDKTDLLAFLDILACNDELFAWDDDDDLNLHCVLVAGVDHRPGLYPRDWGQLMVEIDLGSWCRINEMTRTKDQLGRGSDDWRIRLAAIILRYSGSLTVPQNVLTPLNISLDEFPYTSVSRAVATTYKTQTHEADFESEQFWAGPELQHWVLKRGEDLCRGIWRRSPHLSALQQVETMHLVLTGFHPNLTLYIHSLLTQIGFNRFQELQRDEKASNLLKALKEYYLHVEQLLVLLKYSIANSHINAPWDSHAVAQTISKHLQRDVLTAAVRLVIFLGHEESYREFLACRGMEAQHLLDLLQDLLDLDSLAGAKPVICKGMLRLSRASGLHPRCFPVSGFQAIGEQVAAGGFGDIWKGRVCGQTVSIKIMRIFQDSDTQVIVKEFGREALIWCQLCHPNLLPFFGLYYLENRLCLISPWMENGNVLEF
ncbi:hypothetical protein C8F04DRAFT_1087915 [Mycena alexandri]|uniref:Protein kinase domain-containing protein n=1 Tax=Mycena alexandri TaxID=1745969 RepID=A0AAD6T475_9AGAR|nr:hypothetical protein C8F04DRAFT_1087915 [Mycena alexandri]